MCLQIGGPSIGEVHISPAFLHMSCISFPVNHFFIQWERILNSSFFLKPLQGYKQCNITLKHVQSCYVNKNKRAIFISFCKKKKKQRFIHIVISLSLLIISGTFPHTPQSAIDLYMSSSWFRMAGGFPYSYHIPIINFLWTMECFHLKGTWNQPMLWRMIQPRKT